MLRILLCMTCCSAPPSSRSEKRKVSSIEGPRKSVDRGSTSSNQKSESLLEDERTNQVTPGGSEKDQSLVNQVQANNDNYGNKQGAQGAALTSASQDSLSDAAFGEVSAELSRPANPESGQPTGAALVGDSVELSGLEDLTRPAPLATGEDEPPGEPSSVSSRALDNSQDNVRASERVGSPQSINTTTSGALTNPTPTPSEMSTGSGKKRLKAKALFKRFKPGSKKKKNKDEII